MGQWGVSDLSLNFLSCKAFRGQRHGVVRAWRPSLTRPCAGARGGLLRGERIEGVVALGHALGNKDMTPSVCEPLPGAGGSETRLSCPLTRSQRRVSWKSKKIKERHSHQKTMLGRGVNCDDLWGVGEGRGPTKGAHPCRGAEEEGRGRQERLLHPLTPPPRVLINRR